MFQCIIPFFSFRKMWTEVQCYIITVLRLGGENMFMGKGLICRMTTAKFLGFNNKCQKRNFEAILASAKSCFLKNVT